ncbi:MAG: MBL fold metallo-hydrolase [Sheuella sp.]|nr:MBL fold metallo-hydrolase [Sheuella sp.]
MQKDPSYPRPAATIILARDSAHGIEVFMMKRATAVTFAKGMHVFPGGGVDASDHQADMHALCVGIDDASASVELGLQNGGLAYWIAAIRECFEEAGLLIGYRNKPSRLPLDATDAQKLAALRIELAENNLSFAQLLSREQLLAATDQLIYYSHWITTPGRPRRYDTRFFIAPAPAEQIAMHDNSETVAHLWVRPGEALELFKRGELDLMFPTIKTLESLMQFGRVEDLLTHARTKPQVPATTPHVSTARDGSIRMLIQSDYAYAEAQKLDPENKGTTKSDIDPGHPVQIAPNVWRLTAPNPGVMTGPGTNTYLLGTAQDGVAVIDPGPDLEEHIEAIIDCAPGPIKWILTTHTHRDHSPATQKLKTRTQATVLGIPAPPYANQDQDFKPDVIPTHHEVFALGEIRLRAIHTPGHASNHLCYLLESEKMLFTGDHLMQGSTVVINPPDGDMQAYLQSLQMLKNEEIEYLAPGHGFLIGNPEQAIDRLTLHRLTRENKIIAALQLSNQPQTIDTLVKVAYQDTPVQRHALAARSLLAHLHKLKQEMRVIETDERWSFVTE